MQSIKNQPTEKEIYMEHYGKYGKCVTFCYCINAGNQNA